MTYKDIIRQNRFHHSSVNWWPLYAYHFTDIQNAVSILKEEYLYSRYDAKRFNIMRNDNASRQVIDMTHSGATADVKFYFRPLTPTQYYNEGFKHPDLRYCGDINANVPVPVFFAFDLESLLSMDNVYFSEKSQAGEGCRLCNTPEEFSQFNFDQIYNNSWMRNIDEEKKYRQAELVTKGPFPINSCLYAILCRNEVEKITLLNLLRDESPKTYTKYKDKIKVCKENMFECNGLYITDCRYFDGKASILFSNTYEKRHYIRRHKTTKLRPLEATIDFDWVSAKTLLNRQSTKFQIDYEEQSGIQFSGLSKPQNAKTLYTKIVIEGHLMCFMGQQLVEAALL